jgi:hypothetical protein
MPSRESNRQSLMPTFPVSIKPVSIKILLVFPAAAF